MVLQEFLWASMCPSGHCGRQIIIQTCPKPFISAVVGGGVCMNRR